MHAKLLFLAMHLKYGAAILAFSPMRSFSPARDLTRSILAHDNYALKGSRRESAEPREGTRMRRIGSFLKGYTIGTLFVLMHVATHELRKPR